MRRDPYFWLTLSMIGFMGFMALGELWEQDIFWQIRAGNEFMATWAFPTQESWSYTSAGEPWYNFQWLATLAIATVHHLAGIPGLVVLRMMISLAVLGTLTATLSLRLPSVNKWPIIFVTLTLVAVAGSFRTQMRPDFMMLLPYALIGLVWASALPLHRRWLISLLMILIAANLHPGTALFAVAYAVHLAWAPLSTLRRRLLFCATASGSWCLTPYLFQMPVYLKRHIFYSSSTMLENPDHAPLLFSDFINTESGLYALAFLLCTTLCVFALIRLIKKQKADFFRSDNLITWGLIGFLVAMSINRQRTIPLAAIAMAPLMANFLVGLSYRWQGRWFVAPAAVAGALLVGHGLTDKHPIGFKLNDYLYPMECIHFIQQHQPMGQLLHINRWGDAVIGLLPNYKVFADSREMPFDTLNRLFVNLYNQPKLMTEFLARYQVHTVMLPMDFFQLPMHKGDLPWSRRVAFFPPADWSVVAYDNHGMVLVSRTPENKALIENYGYRLAIPDVPPEFYVRDPGRSPQSDELFQREVKRCLGEMAGADYCALLEARWLRQDGSAEGFGAARDFILKRLSLQPKDPNARAELEKIDEESRQRPLPVLP